MIILIILVAILILVCIIAAAIYIYKRTKKQAEKEKQKNIDFDNPATIEVMQEPKGDLELSANEFDPGTRDDPGSDQKALRKESNDEYLEGD